MRMNPNKEMRYLGLAMMVVGLGEILFGLSLLLR
jgi:hypothetical protein